MKIQYVSFCFTGEPKRYAVIDEYLSRSAQPNQEDFTWLKEQGVTDVFNFRTMSPPEINFDEKAEVERLGMRYHHIPSATRKPSKKNVETFMGIINEVISKNGRGHMHCKAGVDRTGMYACIYKTIKHLGTKIENEIEMIQMGHHAAKYPEILPWISKYLSKHK